MSTVITRDDDGKIIAVITFRDFYRYKGFTFEFHPYLGACKVNKDLEPSKREGKKFFDVLGEWCNLTNEQKEQTKI